MYDSIDSYSVDALKSVTDKADSFLKKHAGKPVKNLDLLMHCISQPQSVRNQFLLQQILILLKWRMQKFFSCGINV